MLDKDPLEDWENFWEVCLKEPLIYANGDAFPQRFTDVDCSFSYIADHEPFDDHHSTPGESANLAGLHS